MPALKPTEFEGTIVWLGRVMDQDNDLRSEVLTQAHLDFDGIAGEFHGGATRPSCSRVLSQYPRGTEICNVRQLSVVSQEELDEIAARMGLDALDPRWLGTSMVIKGIPDFTRIPPSSRLQTESGACLTVDMENRPCIFPGREIDKDHSGLGPKFKPAAKDRRGVTAWVEREGPVKLGDKVVLHIPDQRVWAHLEAARA